MVDATQQPIVVKRIKKGGAGAHGGAWKLAYADFVTAMMAFFLLMWLLGSTTAGDLKGIADYFQSPLKVSLQGGRGTGDATSLLQGGGEDLARSVGQVAKGKDRQAAEKKRLPHARLTPQDTEKAERARFEEVKQRLEATIEARPSLRPLKNQLLLDITLEGLRVQIIDVQNRPMFDSGNAVLKPYTSEILHEVALSLNELENHVVISGHTDATPYAGGDRGYSNWELSADRANACRRELLAGGLAEDKISRVVGLSSSVPFNPQDPFDPANRRISIVVLTKRAEEMMGRGASAAEPEVDASAPLGAAAGNEKADAASTDHRK